MADEQTQMNIEEETERPLPDIYQNPDDITTKDIVELNTFSGTYPFEVILDGLNAQFSNYIELEYSDKLDYVEIFFEQFNESMKDIIEEEDDLYEEKLEYMDKLYNEFIDHITLLFQKRLNISLNFIEDNRYDDTVFPVISELYEFFILGARTNFINCFSSVLLLDVKKNNISEGEMVPYMNSRLEDMGHQMMLDMDIQSFLNKCNDVAAKHIWEYYDDNIIGGNFLTKYSPKFYENPSLMSDITSAVIEIYMMHKSMSRED